MVFCLNDEPALFWTGNLTENDPIVFIAIKSFEHVRNVCCLLPKLLLYFFGVNEAQQLTKSNQIILNNNKHTCMCTLWQILCTQISQCHPGERASENAQYWIVNRKCWYYFAASNLHLNKIDLFQLKHWDATFYRIAQQHIVSLSIRTFVIYPKASLLISDCNRQRL